jgi:hypothetical protein
MRFVRKFLAAFGAISLLVLIVGAGGLFYVQHQSRSFDVESRAFTDAAVTAITTHWSATELLKRASPEFLEASQPEDVQEFVATAAERLGPLVAYPGVTGEARVRTDNLHGTMVTAMYETHAQFAKGEVELQVSLVLIDGKWMINGFHLHGTSPAEAVAARDI